ncbi:hypothetical protein [Pseudomonas sp. RL_5y_Pfl2_73]|uniref:hypothetical protein n=1 Tax=Pseudomonas sp. RL_5y_Pfl2_73 TaxID=3088713 RepID=UPI0030DCFF90
MTVSFSEKIFMVVGIIDLGGIFIWIGMCLYLAYKKMDLILDHLKNCSAVMTIASLRHGGPWGKLMLVGGISGLITFPNFYLKRGGLSAEDINTFPASLKRKLVVLQWCVIALLSVMIILAMFVKFGLA